MINAFIGKTKLGGVSVELKDEHGTVMKAYLSPDEQKLRIVLPELKGYKQTLISPENRLIEFTRQA